MTRERSHKATSAVRVEEEILKYSQSQESHLPLGVGVVVWCGDSKWLVFKCKVNRHKQDIFRGK